MPGRGWWKKDDIEKATKGIDDLKAELRSQKRSAKIYLIIGTVFSGIFGYILGKFFP